MKFKRLSILLNDLKWQNTDTTFRMIYSDKIQTTIFCNDLKWQNTIFCNIHHINNWYNLSYCFKHLLQLMTMIIALIHIWLWKMYFGLDINEFSKLDHYFFWILSESWLLLLTCKRCRKFLAEDSSKWRTPGGLSKKHHYLFI